MIRSGLPVLWKAIPTVNRSTLCGLKGDFTLFAAV